MNQNINTVCNNHENLAISLINVVLKTSLQILSLNTTFTLLFCRLNIFWVAPELFPWRAATGRHWGFWPWTSPWLRGTCSCRPPSCTGQTPPSCHSPCPPPRSGGSLKSLFLFSTKKMISSLTSFEFCQPEPVLSVCYNLTAGGDGVKMSVTGRNFVNIHNTVYLLWYLHWGESEGEVAHDSGLCRVLVEHPGANLKPFVGVPMKALERSNKTIILKLIMMHGISFLR